MFTLQFNSVGLVDLVTPFIVDAMQELRKAGLAIHVITQSSLDFGDPSVFQTILSHAPWLAWYQSLSPADQELGAKALANATFDPLAVHYTRTRMVHDGERPASTESRGETTDPHTGTTRHEHRTGTTYLPAFRHVTDAYYKTPQLHEQEFKTKLATLRVGERVVRDRLHVRHERVRPIRPPWLRTISDAWTRAVLERVRSQPIYLPGLPPAKQPATRERLPDAAARLRQSIVSSGLPG